MNSVQISIHGKQIKTWIANWNDAYPIEIYPPPYGQGSGAEIHNNINKAYNTIVSHASWHTFPCERLRNHICSYLPQSEKVKKNSSIIPHIVINRFKKTSTNKNSKFVLCHAGDFGPPRNSGIFLDGVARFVKQTGAGSSVLIKFIGVNHNPVDFENKIREFGLNSIVSFEGSKSYVDSLEYLSQADVLVIIEAPCPEGIFLPSKFVDYVQTGRPILAVSPTVGTLADILDKYGGGIATDVNSPQAISRAIEQLYSHWKADTLDNTYSSSRLFEMFSEKRILNCYTEIFERICN